MMRISRPWQCQQYAAAAAMLSLFPAFALGAAPQTNKPAAGAEIQVGIDDGDIRGGDNRVLQAAVDYVAKMGGGTVRVGPGRYKMRHALVLRDNVRVCGVPGKTVIVTSNAVKSRLAVDGDCNERQITVEDPSGFQVGDGVVIRDDRYAGGFEVTTATLTARVRRTELSHLGTALPRLHGVAPGHGMPGLPGSRRLECAKRCS